MYMTPGYIYVALKGIKLQLFFTGIHKLERNTTYVAFKDMKLIVFFTGMHELE